MTGITYMGGKTYLYSLIKPYFPKIEWNKTLFIDLFGGGGNFIFQKVKDYPQGLNWYNDKYFPIWNIFIQLRDNYQEVIKKLELSVYSKGIFDYSKKFIENKENWNNHLDLAVNFIILCYYSFNSLCKNFKGFQINNRHINTLENIKEIIKYAKYISFYNKDYKEILSYIKNNYIKGRDYRKKWNIFIYLDPPYYNKEKYYKTLTFNHKELKEELDKIKNIERLYLLLSYNNEDYIKELYKDYYIKEILVRYLSGKNRNIGDFTELLITNYDLNNIEKNILIF